MYLLLLNFLQIYYDSDGQLIISKKHDAVNLQDVREKVRSAVRYNKVKTTQGNYISTKVETICVHSDTPNAHELAAEIADELLNLVNNYE